MRTSSAWFLLLAAGLLEIVMALALKQAAGWTRPWPGAVGVAAALGSVFLLTLALEHLPLGPAYAVWTGVGAVGVTLAGVVMAGAGLPPSKLVWMALIFAGVIGLRLHEA